MAQLEHGATALADHLGPGLEYLIEAFPDEDGSFDLCGYASGRVCIFLSLLRPSTSLPSRQQVAGVLRKMAEQVRDGRSVFPLDLGPFERPAVRRLADVFVEVVVEGAPRSFPLIEGYHENGAIGVCVSQGFRDVVVGRWDQWTAASAAEPEGTVAAVAEEEAAPDASAPPQDAPESAAGTAAEPASGVLRLQLRRLAGIWPAAKSERRGSSELQPAEVA